MTLSQSHRSMEVELNDDESLTDENIPQELQFIEDAKQQVIDNHLILLKQLQESASQDTLDKSEKTYEKALTKWKNLIESETKLALTEDNRAQNLVENQTLNSLNEALKICEVNNIRWRLLKKHTDLANSLSSKNTFNTINRLFENENTVEEKQAPLENGVVTRMYSGSRYPYYFAMWQMPMATYFMEQAEKVLQSFRPSIKRH